MENEWFVDWFDTIWYHKLYKHRDDKGAHRFIDALIDYLKPPVDSTFLDLACGKGRHARHLAEKGYIVTGVDLSSESILTAKKKAMENLSFAVHDMRQLYQKEAFNYIFNLFTSFGYFDREEDNVAVLKNMGLGLAGASGRIVIDFLNAHTVRKGLVPSEVIKVDGLTFNIKRKVDDKFVTKDIVVVDQGSTYQFQERVRLFELADFEHLFAQANLQIAAVFGDYKLKPFEADSKRLILVGQLNS